MAIPTATAHEYYISTPVVNNDLKGVGAFIMAGVEMEGLMDRQEKAQVKERASSK